MLQGWRQQDLLLAAALQSCAAPDSSLSGGTASWRPATCRHCFINCTATCQSGDTLNVRSISCALSDRIWCLELCAGWHCDAPEGVSANTMMERHRGIAQILVHINRCHLACRPMEHPQGHRQACRGARLQCRQCRTGFLVDPLGRCSPLAHLPFPKDHAQCIAISQVCRENELVGGTKQAC